MTTASTAPAAFVVTGPTSGYGRLTALQLAKAGTIVLVGRDRNKLADVVTEIEAAGGKAVVVVADFTDIASVRRAATEIAALPVRVVGVVNNAGMREEKPTTTKTNGWDTTFATNHLGPFAFTEALLPSLPDDATVLFIASAVEDPERKQSKAAGFRGARWISAEAGSRGQWREGGSTKLGFDSYATSKQGNLASAMALSREHPRLRINAIEPGFSPSTGLGRDAPAFLRLVVVPILSVLAPLLIKGATTPDKAARVIADVVQNKNGETGAYYDEGGHHMKGSVEVSDPVFQDRVVRETRALLDSV